jgi:hypothetical protein
LVWFVVLPGAVSAGALERLFAPKAELGERWAQHDTSDTRRIDHGDWDRFPGRYVKRSRNGIRRVAYKAVSAQHRRALNEPPPQGKVRPEVLPGVLAADFAQLGKRG